MPDPAEMPTPKSSSTTVATSAPPVVLDAGTGKPAIFPHTNKPPASQLEMLMMAVAKRLDAATTALAKLETVAVSKPGTAALDAAVTHARNHVAALGRVEGGLNAAWWGLRAAQDHSDLVTSTLKGA